MAVNEDEADPKNNCLVRAVSKYLPLQEDYAPDGAFFVFSSHIELEELERGSCLHQAAVAPESCVATTAAIGCQTLEIVRRRRWAVTPLFLAVVTLLAIDAVF